MAERKNFLDREYENKKEKGGDSLLPYSIALIPGLTALEQDALAEDVASRIVKAYNGSRYLNGTPDNIEDLVEGRKFADFLERSIQRMPEPLRDSWLMTVSEDDATPYFFGSEFPEAYYKPSSKNVYIDKSLFRLRPNAALHEYFHKMNHDLNLYHPAYKGVNSALVPDRMLEISLGRTISGDMPKTFSTKVGAIDRKELMEETARRKNRGEGYKGFFENTLENAGIYEPVRYGEMSGLSKNEKLDKLEMMQRKNEFLSDAMTLNPSFRSDLYDITAKDVMGYGHPKDYIDRKAGYTVNLLEAMNENGVTPREPNISPEYAALSLEGSAELADLMSTEGGEEYVKEKSPKTYERMMREYRHDPRRDRPKRNIPAWKMYSHESPYNVYKYRGEPVAFDPKKERRYLRVPTAYGDYIYSDDFYKGRRDAAKRRRNFIEYRDLDGKWKRFYPKELEDQSLKMITAPEYAKMFGKKLLKGVK